jgi:hypothetical protein
VLRAPRTGCRVCTVFSSNHRAKVWFHSSALAPGQSAASPTADLHLDYLTVVVRTGSLTNRRPGTVTGKQGDEHFDMSFHGRGMHGNVEARCSRLCVTTPLPEPGQQHRCCGENMSFVVSSHPTTPSHSANRTTGTQLIIPQTPPLLQLAP